jgi:hypothetical protein
MGAVLLARQVLSAFRRSAVAMPTHPLFLDQVGVPAQQGPRGADQAQLAEVPSRQQPCQRGQDRAVGPGQPRHPDPALQDGDLVAQDEDLGVLGAVGPGDQGKPAEDAQHRQISQS